MDSLWSSSWLGIHYVVQLASNPWQSSCLGLPRARMTGLSHGHSQAQLILTLHQWGTGHDPPGLATLAPKCFELRHTKILKGSLAAYPKGWNGTHKEKKNLNRQVLLHYHGFRTTGHIPHLVPPSLHSSCPEAFVSSFSGALSLHPWGLRHVSC